MKIRGMLIYQTVCILCKLLAIRIFISVLCLILWRNTKPLCMTMICPILQQVPGSSWTLFMRVWEAIPDGLRISTLNIAFLPEDTGMNLPLSFINDIPHPFGDGSFVPKCPPVSCTTLLVLGDNLRYRRSVPHTTLYDVFHFGLLDVIMRNN